MPTPVRWKQGPWANLSIPGSTAVAPEASPPGVSTPASPFSQLAPGEPMEPGGRGAMPNAEPPGWGKSSVLSAIDSLPAGVKAGIGLATGMVPPLGKAWMGLQALTYANKFADPYAENPMFGFPSLEEIEAARSTNPTKAAEMEAERAIGLAGMDPTLSATPTKDWGPPQPQSFPEQEDPFGGWMGEDSGGGESNPGEGSNPSGVDSSGGVGGVGDSGGEFAKGGVLRTRGRKRVVLGDNPSGRETMIAVPQEMERPGMQENEMEVLQALLQTLQRLRGGGSPSGTGRSMPPRRS